MSDGCQCHQREPLLSRLPEFTKEVMEAYTPSCESESLQEFYGRRRLRIINGQDPEKHPEKFTLSAHR